MPRLSVQLGAGTNPKIVSEVLGHKEVAITVDRYSQALPKLHTRRWRTSTRSWAEEHAAPPHVRR